MTLKKIIIARHGDTWKVSREREGSGESGVFSTLEECFDYVRAVYDEDGAEAYKEYMKDTIGYVRVRKP